MSEYSTKEYWDKRYEEYQFYSNLKGILKDSIRKGEKVLVSGCGNSELSAKLYDHGYTNITNIDFSSVVIKQMKSKYTDRPGLSYIECDVTKKFPFGRSPQFDVIIDKATLDVILCSDNGDKKVSRMLGGLYRILKPGGRYVVVSYQREGLLRAQLNEELFRWKIACHKVKKPSFVELPQNDRFHYVPLLQHCLMQANSD